MKNNPIEVGEHPDMTTLVVFQKDNNLDRKDNLGELPAKPAVFAMCGRINGQPVNPRYVGETENLQKALQKLFDKDEPPPEGNEAFKAFMLSIKLKQVVYALLPDASAEERTQKKEEWQKRYDPQCDKDMNAVY
ncbi:MAG: hypothetical protein ICV83_25965 [Cytophagales bacterium]|nr:hypothetical protein [Cytophagales bacterium]